MLDPNDCYYIGYVKKPHGLKGAIDLFLDVDHPDEYKNKESVLLKINNNLVPFFIESISIKGNIAAVKFEGVNNGDESSPLVGSEVYLPLDQLPKLTGKDQFYFHEIIGFSVIDKTHGTVGAIQDVIDNVQQQFLHIVADGKEVLVPITDEIVLEVDRTSKTLHINAPDGLIDLYIKEK